MMDQNVAMVTPDYDLEHRLLHLDAPKEYIPDKGTTGQTSSVQGLKLMADQNVVMHTMG